MLLEETTTGYPKAQGLHAPFEMRCIDIRSCPEKSSSRVETSGQRAILFDFYDAGIGDQFRVSIACITYQGTSRVCFPGCALRYTVICVR